ncbi:hypothetical protein GGQ84_001853 [Desulfitispora alkaliphila]|uniref:PHP domain-containing protein n=1 Tax=Desulfitispora alkaliphila TaxID=622674 RepID=UPI003D20F73B
MIDLHIHTRASDGTLSPSQVIQKAVEKGLSAVAITDHDTVDGVEEAITEAKKYKEIEVIPGIELSTYWKKAEIHILGYYIEYKSKWLLNTLSYLQSKRLERVKKMIDKLNHMGYKINYKDVVSKTEGSVGRPHVASALVDYKYVTSIGEAFDNLIGYDKPAYVPRYKLTPAEAIKIINKAKGVAVLAHPGLYASEWEGAMDEMLTAGLKGIEVYYRLHSQELQKHLLNLTNRHCLIATGGSDFHGGNREENLMGTPEVPATVLQQLQEAQIEGKCQ